MQSPRDFHANIHGCCKLCGIEKCTYVNVYARHSMDTLLNSDNTKKVNVRLEKRNAYKHIPRSQLVLNRCMHVNADTCIYFYNSAPLKVAACMTRRH